jgi:hypothetical protein
MGGHFHANRRQSADSRAGTGHTAPGRTTLPPAFTPPRRDGPGTVTLPQDGSTITAVRGGNWSLRAPASAALWHSTYHLSYVK